MPLESLSITHPTSPTLCSPNMNFEQVINQNTAMILTSYVNILFVVNNFGLGKI